MEKQVKTNLKKKLKKEIVKTVLIQNQKSQDTPFCYRCKMILMKLNIYALCGILEAHWLSEWSVDGLIRYKFACVNDFLHQ